MAELECDLEVMEQPAEKVKFRMEVHSHRCQHGELLLGRTTMPDDMIAFPKVRVVPRPGATLRRGTLVRMSLVDVRSSADRVIDHWHRLVDCKDEVLSTKWAVVKQVEEPYGWVTFSHLGVVKSLERERAKEVGERAVSRLEERGENIRGNRHTLQEVRDRAQETCRETCAFKLKLCFEAFLPAEDGRTIVRVAEPVFSEDILDETRPDKTGDLPIQKISTCTDFVEGGQEVMVFTGNDNTKINLKRSNFFVEFFELDQNNQRAWKSGRIMIPKCDLHGLGQILGGVSFKVPVYDRDRPGSGKPADIDTDTDNVYLELVKANKAGKEEAKSDPLFFSYRPSRNNLRNLHGKRTLELDPREMIHRYEEKYKLPKIEEPPCPFIPVFDPVTFNQLPTTVTITNLPIGENIPITVDILNQQAEFSPLPSSSTLCFPVPTCNFLTPTTLTVPHLYSNPTSPSAALANLQNLQIHSPLPSSYSTIHYIESSPHVQQMEDPSNQDMLQFGPDEIENILTNILAPDTPTFDYNDINFDGNRTLETVVCDAVPFLEEGEKDGLSEDENVKIKKEPVEIQEEWDFQKVNAKDEVPTKEEANKLKMHCLKISSTKIKCECETDCHTKYSLSKTMQQLKIENSSK